MLQLYYTTLERGNDSAAAHALLAAAWAHWSGGAALPEICIAAAGKPDFEFIHGPHFSLSHSKTMAVVALCAAVVGVDAETLCPHRPRLWQRVLAEQELQQLRQAADADLAFLEFWTRKEAYVKMTGEGLHSGFQQLCFDLASGRLAGHTRVQTGSCRLLDCVVSWCTPQPVEPISAPIFLPASSCSTSISSTW